MEALQKLKESEAKVAAYMQRDAEAEAKAAADDCCADENGCSLGQKVSSVTTWEGEQLFKSVAAPEGHSMTLQTGAGGTHIAPMQAVLGAAATCSAIGVLNKLKDTCTVAKFSVAADARRAPMPHLGIPQSVFRTIRLKYVITSPDATEQMVQECIKDHSCSVLANLGGVSTTTQSARLLRP